MSQYFIWGMGLLGTSLAIDLKKKGHIITGCVRTRSSLEYLKQYNFDTFCLSNEEIMATLIEQADGVIIGTPVNIISDILKQINQYTLKKNTWVIDMASTKSNLVNEIENLNLNFPFIGTHPMAGSNLAGPQNAIENLFTNANIYITKLPQQENKIGSEIYNRAYENIVNMWQSIMAKPMLINAREHDILMAYLSHGPHLISCAISLLTNNIPPILNLQNSAGGCFKDMTRVSKSLPSLWKEIIDSNNIETKKYLEEMVLLLNTWIQDINHSNLKVDTIFDQASISRDKIIP